MSTIYNHKGKVLETGNYKEGFLHGCLKTYSILTSNLKREIPLENGQIEGTIIHYLGKNKAKLAEITYHKGLKHGISIYFDDNVYETITYRNGKINSNLKTFNLDGIHLQEITYNSSNSKFEYKITYNKQGVISKKKKVKKQILNYELDTFLPEGLSILQDDIILPK